MKLPLTRFRLGPQQEAGGVEGGGGWGVLFVDDIRLPTTTAPISNNKMGSVKSGRSGAVDAAVAS